MECGGDGNHAGRAVSIGGSSVVIVVGSVAGNVAGGVAGGGACGGEAGWLFSCPSAWKHDSEAVLWVHMATTAEAKSEETREAERKVSESVQELPGDVSTATMAVSVVTTPEGSRWMKTPS
jgi:hypothetical protein